MAEWILVPQAAQLKVGAMTCVSASGQHLIVYRTADGFFATERRCTHQRADLSRGYFDRDVIECPVHQGRFDVRTGAALSAPASQPLKTYQTRVTDGEVYVAIETAASG
ncbi:MAG TPA: non-heme iron oxygenase ferredoxin subunit [Steroidobacteraceae bacterium]|jgi:nitrite reductase/ring-hydroxylating ferredoxin subunit